MGSELRLGAAAACALAVALTVSGCTGAAQQDSDAPSTQPSAPTEGLGPTEQPELPVVEGKADEEVKLPTRMVVAIESITTTTVTAETPGDVAGDAVVVLVSVTNTSKSAQNVDSAVVSLETDAGELGIPTNAGDPSPFAGDVQPGESAEGRYLFMLDPVHDRDVIINVNYAAGEPVAQFTGLTP